MKEVKKKVCENCFKEFEYKYTQSTRIRRFCSLNCNNIFKRNERNKLRDR